MKQDRKSVTDPALTHSEVQQLLRRYREHTRNAPKVLAYEYGLRVQTIYKYLRGDVVGRPDRWSKR